MTDSELNQLFEVARPKLLQAACAILTGKRYFDVFTAAENAVQDALLAAWEASKDGDAITEWKLKRLVKQKCNDFLDYMDVRAPFERVSIEEVLDVALESGGDDDMPEVDPRVYAIEDAAALISPILRGTFERHYFDGDSCEEIAAQDGTNLSTVLMRLRRARAAIQKIIDPGCDISRLSAA